MAESNSSSQQIPGKLHQHFYFKFIIMLFIIVLLPFFPSQAPESLSKSLLTNHWEFLQLLFIGIVVSYGLFSSRSNVSMNSEAYSNTDLTQTYLSGISHFSSIFENRVENYSGFDDKRGMHGFYNQDMNEESMTVLSNGCSKYGSYNAHHVFDKLPKPSPRSSFGYKLLGLPVRSLKIRDAESGYPEVINESESSSGLKDFSECVDKMDNDEIRGLAPINLEEKLEEIVVRSPIPWGSRSCKLQKREEYGIFEFNSSKSRPFSVGKIELEPINPQPFRLAKAPRVSLKDSKFSHISSKGSSSIFSSVSSVETKTPSPSFAQSKMDVLPNVHSNTKEFSQVNVKRIKGKLKDFRVNKKVAEVVDSVNFDAKSNQFEAISEAPGVSLKDSKFSHTTSKDSSSVFSSLPSVETKLPTPLSKSDEPPNVYSNTEEFSKTNAKRGFKGNLKDFSENKVNEVVDSSSLDAKSNKFEAISKGKSRGKSVRTVRPSETFLESMKTEQVHSIQNENLEHVSLKKHNPKNFSCETNPSFLKYRKGQRQVLADGSIVESERESESDFGNPEASSDDEKWDQESDSGEVDKKASEFIAKFKEQIRLQRVRLYL